MKVVIHLTDICCGFRPTVERFIENCFKKTYLMYLFYWVYRTFVEITVAECCKTQLAVILQRFCRRKLVFIKTWFLLQVIKSRSQSNTLFQPAVLHVCTCESSDLLYLLAKRSLVSNNSCVLDVLAGVPMLNSCNALCVLTRNTDANNILYNTQVTGNVAQHCNSVI